MLVEVGKKLWLRLIMLEEVGYVAVLGLEHRRLYYALNILLTIVLEIVRKVPEATTYIIKIMIYTTVKSRYGECR